MINIFTIINIAIVLLVVTLFSLTMYFYFDSLKLSTAYKSQSYITDVLLDYDKDAKVFATDTAEFKAKLASYDKKVEHYKKLSNVAYKASIAFALMLIPILAVIVAHLA